MERENQYIYSPSVLEFIKVGTEYCRYLEDCRGQERARFIDVMRTLLPMIYLKAGLLHDVDEAEGYAEPCVTEADYDYVRSAVSSVMADRDDYLDVFVEDFRYSDKPVLRTVSEDLADVYQSLRELVEAYRVGYEEAMQAALYEAWQGFQLSWGQTVLNALRALHDAKFGGGANE